MMRRARAPRPEPTATDDAVLARDARTALAELRAAGASLPERRAGWQRLDRAFAAADQPLRSLAAAAKAAPYGKGSYRHWAHWRHQLSQLNLDRQRHLFAHSDDLPVLDPGTVRALDSGMSGPSIGELQHGESVPAGTVPTYGLDLATTMGTAEQNRPGPVPGYRLMTPAARPRLTAMSPRPVSVAPVAPTPVAPAPVAPALVTSARAEQPEQPERRPEPTLPNAPAAPAPVAPTPAGQRLPGPEPTLPDAA